MQTDACVFSTVGDIMSSLGDIIFCYSSTVEDIMLKIAAHRSCSKISVSSLEI